MSISSNSAACLVMMAGCNGLLGIERAIDDRDRDGVADLADNCPDDNNPQQLDGDANGLGNVCDCVPVEADVDGDGIDDACDDCVGVAEGVDSGNDGVDDGCQLCREAIGADVDDDGIDDACDVCLEGSPHDEDGDDIADGCDNCPSLVNPDQAGAAIGDACFVFGDRSVFDPFVVQDVTTMPGVVDGWTWEDDGLVLTYPVPGTSIRAATFPLGANVVVETLVGTTELAVLSVGGFNGDGVECMYVPAQGIVQTNEIPFDNAPNKPIAASPVGPVRLQLRINSIGGAASCVVLDDTGEHEAAASVVPDPFRVRLGGRGVTRFEYLWIATE